MIAAAPPRRRSGPQGWIPWLLAAPALLICIAFVVAPLAGLLRYSTLPGERAFDGTGLSAQHYARLLSDTQFPAILAETLAYGAIVVTISLFIGFPIAYSLSRMTERQRRWRLIIVILPLTLSLVVVVFGWLVILGRDGIVNSLLVGLGLFNRPQRLLYNRVAVIVVLVQQFLPFMILSIMSVLTSQDPVLEEAAASLRANRLCTLRRVVIPLALPGMVAGSTLVFVLTITAFITPRLIGGNRVQMVGTLIYDQIVTLFNWPYGSALALALLAVTLAVTWLGMLAATAITTGAGRRHAG